MKKLAIVGGVVVVALVVVLYLGISNLGPIIKKAVNSYGPKITKTQVRLEEVDLSIFSGQAELKQFSLGNPKGFHMPTAIDVGSVYVDVDEGSLTGKTIIIDQIAVVRPEITYEKARGTDNFRAILANVKETVGSGQTGEKGTPAEKETGGKKMMIREFLLEGGKVNLAMPLLSGKTVSTSLPDIHLKDIGTEEEGVTPAAAFEKILSMLYAKIQSPAVTEKLNEALKQVKEGAKALQERAEQEVEAARSAAEKEIESAKSAAKQEAEAVQKRAQDKLQEGTEKMKKEVEGLGDKVGGFLGN